MYMVMYMVMCIVMYMVMCMVMYMVRYMVIYVWISKFVVCLSYNIVLKHLVRITFSDGT